LLELSVQPAGSEVVKFEPVSVDPLWARPGEPLAEDEADGELDGGALEVVAFVADAVGVTIGTAAAGFLSVCDTRYPPPTSRTSTAATTPMTRPVRDFFFAGRAGGYAPGAGG
jgi:hypothetical protein